MALLLGLALQLGMALLHDHTLLLGLALQLGLDPPFDLSAHSCCVSTQGPASPFDLCKVLAKQAPQPPNEG